MPTAAAFKLWVPAASTKQECIPNTIIWKSFGPNLNQLSCANSRPKEVPPGRGDARASKDSAGPLHAGQATHPVKKGWSERGYLLLPLSLRVSSREVSVVAQGQRVAQKPVMLLPRPCQLQGWETESNLGEEERRDRTGRKGTVSGKFGPIPSFQRRGLSQTKHTFPLQSFPKLPSHCC